MDEDDCSLGLLLAHGAVMSLQATLDSYTAATAADSSDWDPAENSSSAVAPTEAGAVHAINCLDVSSAPETAPVACLAMSCSFLFVVLTLCMVVGEVCMMARSCVTFKFWVISR